MAEFPAMPLWTGDFLADTMHLTAEETGAYMMLLMCAWRSEDCALPDDDKKLQRMSRVNRRNWPRVRDAVMPFWTLKDGKWTQKKLSKVRGRVHDIARTRREIGARGGKAKALKNKKPDLANGSDLLEQNPTIQNQNQSTLLRKGEIPPNGGADKSAHELLSQVVWKDGLAKLIQLGMREANARGFIGKCLKGSKPAELLEAIDKAHRNGTREPAAYVTKALRSESQSDERAEFERRMRSYQ